MCAVEGCVGRGQGGGCGVEGEGEGAGEGVGEGRQARAMEREGGHRWQRGRVSRGRAWERGAKDLVEESRGEGCTHHTYNRLP